MIEQVEHVQNDVTMMKELCCKILERATVYSWTLQGFGMFRLYLRGVGRVHLWDRTFANPDVSDIHDHFWDLQSQIIAGQMTNIRYGIERGETQYTHMMQTLITGEGGGLIGHPERVRLFVRVMEPLLEGDIYFQRASEVHQSLPLRGTVTVMRRDKGGSGETARVFWPIAKSWGSAEPRRATDEEILKASENALQAWF